MKQTSTFYARTGKRLFDLVLTIPGLIVVFPIMLIAALLIRWNMGSPVLFRQQRPGKEEKIFTLLKFRTMNDQRDVEGKLLPDGERLTKLGRIIRKTSMDELPQLLNVIKGDMSLVGPRPLLIRYLPYYTKEEKIRHHVKPGITGLAQLAGRNNLPWDERLSYDVQYVKRLTFFLDLKIIILTLINTFLSKNVNVNPGEKMKSLDHERSANDSKIC